MSGQRSASRTPANCQPVILLMPPKLYPLIKYELTTQILSNGFNNLVMKLVTCNCLIYLLCKHTLRVNISQCCLGLSIVLEGLNAHSFLLTPA